MKNKKLIISEFIPVILVIFYYLFPYQFIYFSHTVLGKLCLVTIVMFYSIAIDRLLGAFAALLFIFYYQTDHIEGFYSLHMDTAAGDAIEKFQNAASGGAAASADNYKNKTSEIVNKKIDVENEIIMPKQSNNINIERKNVIGDIKNTIGTPGVISEEFTLYQNSEEFVEKRRT